MNVNNYFSNFALVDNFCFFHILQEKLRRKLNLCQIIEGYKKLLTIVLFSLNFPMKHFFFIFNTFRGNNN